MTSRYLRSASRCLIVTGGRGGRELPFGLCLRTDVRIIAMEMLSPNHGALCLTCYAQRPDSQLRAIFSETAPHADDARKADRRSADVETRSSSVMLDASQNCWKRRSPAPYDDRVSLSKLHTTASSDVKRRCSETEDELHVLRWKTDDQKMSRSSALTSGRRSL